MICIPLFVLTMGVLIFSLTNAEGFKIIWRYFAWCNQTLAVFTLWAITVYLVNRKKNYFITLIPAILMTAVTLCYILMAPEGFNIPATISYPITACAAIASIIWFYKWKKQRNK